MDDTPGLQRRFRAVIDAELVALRAFQDKPDIHPVLRARIQAQINVLYYDLTLEHVLQQYPDDEDDGEIQGAAEDALGWVEGWDMPAPSELLADYQIYYLSEKKEA